MVYLWAMTREDPQIKLRLPPEMLAELKAIAAQNRRSMNAEIMERLRISLSGAPHDQLSATPSHPDHLMPEEVRILREILRGMRFDNMDVEVVKRQMRALHQEPVPEPPKPAKSRAKKIKV